MSRSRSPLRYALVDSALGPLLVAASTRGVCRVEFLDRPSSGDDLALPDGAVHDPVGLAEWAEAVAARAGGGQAPVPADVRGSAFQDEVWAALAALPVGQTRSYRELAREIGHPGAARAVGRACASNPAPLVLPCHRVVRSDGEPGGYRGGTARKRRLLASEGALRRRGEPAQTSSTRRAEGRSRKRRSQSARRSKAGSISSSRKRAN